MDLDLIIKYRPLWEAVATAHTSATARPNLSTQVIRAIAGAGAEPLRAVTAGLLTLETLHAPVYHARRQFVDMNTEHAAAHGMRVWGFGSSFVKGEPDPLLRPCARELDITQFHPVKVTPLWLDALPVTVRAGRHGTLIYPNLAYYTAILAELIEWPVGMEFLLVATLRAEAWGKLMNTEYALSCTRTI